MQSLAVKYRPKKWEDVIEQSSTITILRQQLETGTHKNCYLFVGGAGTGKTTCARIFANEINKGEGQPIELDAASNNGVDDVREIIQQAQTKSLDSEYKCFILDEVHALSNNAWQALLKLIEEPPTKSIFIMCTTDPQKIPKTILSRVQRYTFSHISQQGIIDRLKYVLENEFRDATEWNWDTEALQFITKLADGGMRDALTLLDKCLAYNEELTIDNVIKALGQADYDIYIKLTDALIYNDRQAIIDTIESVHMSGKDLRQFVHGELDFVLDLCKYLVCHDVNVTQLPETDEIMNMLDAIQGDDNYSDGLYKLLDMLIKLDAAIKFNSAPKMYIEAQMLTW